QASNAFPHAEDAIAAFQPQLSFLRSYTPDIFNGISKLGQVSGFYDGSGHYIRGATSLQNLFKDEGGTLVPLKKSEQFQPFGNGATTPKRCPGGATQPPADNSAPYVSPPHTGSSVNPSECDTTRPVSNP
ncbi:MAG TPA: hypothetical protein VJ204_11190, partial [Solirubrobacterales bacterium]|nr:hypothetical protein [Solirubrobacterales bacterium]